MLLQAVHSASMSKSQGQELSRLCSEIIGATDLADARVKVGALLVQVCRQSGDMSV